MKTQGVLSGGGTVEIYKPFGNEIYFAEVILDGRYPEQGKLAKNFKREEFVKILTGNFRLMKEGIETILKEDDSILISSNECYSLEGKGRCLVMVRDLEGGATDIVEE